MSQNRQDVAPENGDGKALAASPGGEALSGRCVAEYLRRHPDFLARRPELLDVLTPPARSCGNGVIDLQQAMVTRLRDDLSAVTAARDELVTTGRNNLSAQARVHKAILALLAARSFENFIETLTTDVAVILDIDAVTIGVEQRQDNGARAQTTGVCRLVPNTVDTLIGPRQAIALHADIAGDAMLFGAAAGLIGSEALIRLSIGESTPAAVLALGSRDPKHFQPGQGTELLCFLARVVECSIRGWLNLRG